MMTCTSLRSGIASRGVWRSAQRPPAMPKIVRMRMRKVLRELASMTRSRRNVERGALERGASGDIRVQDCFLLPERGACVVSERVDRRAWDLGVSIKLTGFPSY